MKRSGSFLLIISLLLSILLFSKTSDAAVMEDYCAVPPYVIQNVPPNVMIVLDNSGSMFNFAYFDGFNTTTISDDNNCSNTASPCTGFLDPGTYPTFKYYGYFNPDAWYDYQANRFIQTALKSERGKASTEWDGNFLNWLTMRRVDIIRKVMTGGRTTTGEGSNYDRLIGEKADYDGRGKYKKIANADLYTPYSGNRKFYVYSGWSNPSYFGVRNDSGGGDGTGNEATFNVAVRVPSPVEGVLQDVVGTKARLGLSFYNVNTSSSNQGGFVQVAVSGGSLSSTVNQINLTRPNSNTPLAETLWTMAGYFAQQSSIPAVGSPGPRYASGDYQINNNVDPFNQGTGGQPRYPYCSKSFVLYITDGEPCADGNLPASLSDYASGKSIYNCSGTGCPAVGSFPASTFLPCYGENNSSFCNGVVSGCYVAGIEDVALFMHTTDLRNKGGTPDIGVNNINGIQNLNLYTVFAFGKGSTLLRYAAINGGFEDSNGNNIPDLQSEWDQNGDGEPDTFYEAMEGYALEQSLRDATSGMLKRAASGTAASVLASGEGQGANLIQAVFYPRRRIGNDVIGWVGSLQNLWYYLDPFFAAPSLREDTTQDYVLNLTNDDILTLYFDTTAQTTKAALSKDSDGNGIPDGAPYAVKKFDNLFDPIKYLWEAGKLLWSRDLSVSPRTIYTTTDGQTLLSGNFSTGNAGTLRQYLNVANDPVASDIIRFIHGEKLTTLKDADGNILIAGIDRDGDGIDDYRPRYATIVTDTNIWKLGDIVDSTPKILSRIPLNHYDTIYNDNTYSDFTQTNDYKGRGMVFVGGNDGMLHAFKFGTLQLKWNGQGSAEKARLCESFDPANPNNCPAPATIGQEKWAFIPKNALPYLQYFANPEYCHVFTTDLTPYLVDASVNKPLSCADDYWNCDRSVESWRTILIGGMRTGGACKQMNANCSTDTPNGICAPTTESGGASVGYSSYFAIDVTDPESPQLLWEFTDPTLGFATTGPSVVKINGRNADGTVKSDSNGRWFAVFGSGPTGPIDKTNLQFLGNSDQTLKFFILDLKTGQLLRTIDTGIQEAFAGSMINSAHDVEYDKLDYQDDVIYVGYVKKCAASNSFCTAGAWNDGGVIRILTKESLNLNDWDWSYVISGIGPVTTSIDHLKKETTPPELSELWLYFGTGRYFYQQGSTADDANIQRILFGIKEPCYNDIAANLSCSTSVNFGSLFDATAAGSASPTDWRISLDSYDNVNQQYGAERVITNPLSSTTGVVFFTTFKPYLDECSIGGKTYIWAVKYDTGGSAAGLLRGLALVQVSTGAIEQIDLSSAFTERDLRRTSSIEGVPPTAQGLSIAVGPPPVKRVIHMRER